MINSQQKNVLLCGGSGLIGSCLYSLLQEQGYTCTILTRSRKQHGLQETSYWDPATEYVDENVLRHADIIINLAGVGVADKPWSKKRKQEILDSRVQSTRLLCCKLQELQQKPSVFIQSSAIGFYGATEQALATEDSSPAEDFLASVVAAWEKEAYPISNLGIRTVILRIGLVLSSKGGALPKIVRPFRFFLGSALGSGKQTINWIHIRDLCQLILVAAQQEKWRGIYNAVSPESITNHELSLAIAKTLGKPMVVPNIPAFLLQSVLGDMASLILQGRKVSAEKLLKNGFVFTYPNIEDALRDLLV